MTSRWPLRWLPRCPDTRIALALGGAFFLLYLRTLCPTVFLGDSGEICTAIATGGVIHPPGYPLFSLLGRLALLLVPVGEPAFRIGCVVALAAAGTVGVLYRIAREVEASPWAAGVAAAAFGAGYTFWSQSTRVEVYSLHVQLAAIVLLAALRYRRSGAPVDLRVAALALSLGLAHHLTLLLLTPAAALLVGRRFANAPGRTRLSLSLAAIMAVGPTLYLCLGLWAAAQPLQTWGRPDTLALLWNHASARLYQGAVAIPDAARLWGSLRYLATLLTDNFPLGLFLLCGVGGWRLWRRDRATAGSFLAVSVGVTGYNLCYRIVDIAPYYLVVWLALAVLLAVALDGLREQAVRRGVRAPAVAAALVLLPAGLLLRNFGACDLSGATWVLEFARHKLESAPLNSVLITQEDPDIFPIWYAQDVLGVRPDVVTVDRLLVQAAWLNYDRDPSLWYLHRLRQQGVRAPITVPPGAAARRDLGRDGYLLALLNGELRDRPLCLTFLQGEGQRKRALFEWTSRRFHAIPNGLVVRLHPRERPVELLALLAESERLWSGFELPDVQAVRTDQDLGPNYVVDHYACSLLNAGGLYEMAGQPAVAAEFYRRATALAPHYQPAAAALANLQRAASAGL